MKSKRIPRDVVGATTTAISIIVTCLFVALPLVQTANMGSGKPVELYNSSDKLVILNNATYPDTVYNKSCVWFVEFYNSWCGFCQRFAPIWKEFSAGIHVWKGIACVGVVDCANYANNPLCRNLEIMSYPTLKVFPPHSKPDSLGVDLKPEKTVTSIRSALLDFIEKQQQEGIGGPDWPTLLPYRSGEFTNVWKDVPPKILYMFFIFEDAKSYLGREVILDYHKLRTAIIRRSTTNNEALAKLAEVVNYPSLLVLKRDMSLIHILPQAKSREGYASSIHTFLVHNGGIDDATAVREIPREKDLFGAIETPEKLSDTPSKVPDVVFRADLENTLRFSLKHEIAMHRVITGETLTALQEYLRTLASFFPTRPQGTMFLERLRDWALEKEDVIKGEEFIEKVNELEKQMDFIIPEDQEWIGCKGSEHKYRGYTCGLWTLWHTLTVSAASQNKKRLTPGSENVLKNMLLYVKHFFGCDGCSKHFQAMAAERKLESVSDISDAVMWLWEAHNVVNKRLKGDVTEDPHHPKMQFPSGTSCLDCKDLGEDWIKVNVLNYLKQRYGRENICQKTGAAVDQCAPLNAQALLDLEVSATTPESSRVLISDVLRVSGWDFNLADVSLCVFLYLLSAVILITVYFKFVIKRHPKKRYSLK